MVPGSGFKFDGDGNEKPCKPQYTITYSWAAGYPEDSLMIMRNEIDQFISECLDLGIEEKIAVNELNSWN